MIKAIFKFDGKYIKEFEIYGHSNLSEYGTDIVCAAVSASTLMTINGIIEYLKIDAIYEIKEGYTIFKYDKYCDNANTLLNSFYLFISGVQEQYPKNIKLEIMEV